MRVSRDGNELEGQAERREAPPPQAQRLDLAEATSHEVPEDDGHEENSDQETHRQLRVRGLPAILRPPADEVERPAAAKPPALPCGSSGRGGAMPEFDRDGWKLFYED